MSSCPVPEAEAEADIAVSNVREVGADAIGDTSGCCRLKESYIGLVKGGIIGSNGAFVAYGMSCCPKLY